MLLAMKTPEEYFKEAAKIMDEWSRALLDDSDIKHEERLLQQGYRYVTGIWKKPILLYWI